MTTAGTSCSNTDTQTDGLARRMHGRTGGVTLGDDSDGVGISSGVDKAKTFGLLFLARYSALGDVSFE